MIANPQNIDDIAERIQTKTLEAETENALRTVTSDTVRMSIADVITALDPTVKMTDETDRTRSTDTGIEIEIGTGNIQARVTLGATETESIAAIDHQKSARLPKSVAYVKLRNVPRSLSSLKRASWKKRKVLPNALLSPS